FPISLPRSIPASRRTSKPLARKASTISASPGNSARRLSRSAARRDCSAASTRSSLSSGFNVFADVFVIALGSLRALESHVRQPRLHPRAHVSATLPLLQDQRLGGAV